MRHPFVFNLYLLDIGVVFSIIFQRGLVLRKDIPICSECLCPVVISEINRYSAVKGMEFLLKSGQKS